MGIHEDDGVKGKTDEGDSEEEEPQKMFKVILENPHPSEVKISKKNCCIVTINMGDDETGGQDEQKKLLEYYLNQQQVTWSSQFKNAVMLGPTIDQDDLILVDVTLMEALSHFFTISWKVLFASVPPANIWHGKAAFVIALMYIGMVTAIVGEVASKLGCVLQIDDSITAITLVALGTSLPDTFASMAAA